MLSDEVTRRDTHSADLRSKIAGLEGSMRFENWDDSAAVNFDRAIFDELVSLNTATRASPASATAWSSSNITDRRDGL